MQSRTVLTCVGCKAAVGDMLGVSTQKVVFNLNACWAAWTLDAHLILGLETHALLSFAFLEASAFVIDFDLVGSHNIRVSLVMILGLDISFVLRVDNAGWPVFGWFFIWLQQSLEDVWSSVLVLTLNTHCSR